MKTLLARLSIVAVVLATPVMSVSPAGEPGRLDKKLTVVVFGGHPDDPESGAGGLIATLTRQGHEVILAYGTAFRGGRRFFDRPEAEVRRLEATAASKVLGATPKFFPYAHESLGGVLLDRYSLRATRLVLEKARAFAAEIGKKLLVVLFDPYRAMAEMRQGEKRYDGEIVESLKAGKFDVFDMNEVHFRGVNGP